MATDSTRQLKSGGVALAVMLAVALQGCGSVRYPAKQQANGTGAVSQANASGIGASPPVRCQHPPKPARELIVCPGDTLYGIAREYNVSVRGLMRANGLRDSRIGYGDQLILPDEWIYTVRPGDTLGRISRTTGVAQDRIISANDLRNPDRIPVGDRLAIPGNRSAMVAERPARTSVAAPSVTIGAKPAAEAPTPAPASAKSNSKPRPSLANANPKPTPSQANANPAPQMAEAPAAAAPDDPFPRQRPAAPARPKSTEAAPSSPAPPASARPPVPKAAPPAEPAKPTAPTKPAATGQPRFILPVEGRILADFGPTSGGLHNDGINIAAPRGTAIHATADGSVAYAGDGLPGFGNLILVKHADGWTSAYAHAATMAVKRGDAVRQGQTIGTVGDTGSVAEPQLHFELRQHDQAVDPKKVVR